MGGLVEAFSDQPACKGRTDIGVNRNKPGEVDRLLTEAKSESFWMIDDSLSAH